MGSYTYTSMYAMTYVYLSVCACIRSSFKVWTGNGRYICKFAELEFIYKVSIIRYMYICEYFHVYKEVQSVNVRQRTNICEFAQHGFIHESVYNMICILLNICMQTKRF